MTPETTSQLTTREVFERQTEALGAGDIDAVLGCIAAEFVLTDMTNPGEQVHGRAGMRAWLEAFFSSFTIVRSETRSLITEGDRVAAEVEVTATYVGDDFGPEAKGREVVLRFGVFDTVRYGLIRSETAYSDVADLTRQLSGAAS